PSHITFILSHPHEKKSYTVTFPDFPAFLSSISLPLDECIDHEELKRLTTMSQWIPTHPWAYSEYVGDDMKKILGMDCYTPMMKKAYHLAFSPEHYKIRIGVVMKEEDKEIMQEKKEKGKDEEEEKRVEAKAAAFGFSFSSEVEHVPKDIRTPDFFEITHSELGDFLGVPLVSEISWSAILQFQFFLGF
ncbi:hypothetical protein ADUPG1_001615, partial [Aduncisulcus paluster]